MNKFKTVDFIIISLIAAILCILAPVSIPLGFTPVSITLGLFVMIMAGIILGRVRGLLCVLVYILLGTVGMPVFSGYMGGIQKVLGPTGGYILGYLFLVWVTGYFTERFGARIPMCLLGATIGTAICYGFGTVWISIQMQITFAEAFMVGVVPFLFFDILKIILAVVVCCPIRSRLMQLNLISESNSTKE